MKRYRCEVIPPCRKNYLRTSLGGVGTSTGSNFPGALLRTSLSSNCHGISDCLRISSDRIDAGSDTLSPSCTGVRRVLARTASSRACTTEAVLHPARVFGYSYLISTGGGSVGLSLAHRGHTIRIYVSGIYRAVYTDRSRRTFFVEGRGWAGE